MRLAELFNREHLKTYVCQDDNVSSVMSTVDIAGECLGDLCHEVVT